MMRVLKLPMNWGNIIGMRIPILISLFIQFLAAEPIVFRVPIQGTIDLGLPPFIERTIAAAEEADAAAIIFEIDTFGGRVDGATSIKNSILSVDTSITTVAFIKGEAASAGALISLSCEKIIMSKGASIGAATAVDMQGNKASEKVISYMRSMMSSTAEARGRNSIIAEAMVDEEISFDTLVVDGVTLIVDDVQGAKEGKLVTLSTDKALKYNIADDKAETIDEVLAILGLSHASIRSANENWSENFVRFLTNPIVASLLTTFGFLGILFELQSPGWGIPGFVGLACLILSLGASYIVRLATLTDLLIVFVGVVLLLVEVLLIPGFGIAGISGIGIILWGLYELLLPDVPVGQEIHSMAITGLTIGIIGGIIGLILLFKLMTKTEFWQKLTSPTVQKKDEGYNSSIGLEDLIEQKGVADTDLRPSGWINVGNQRIFVVTEGSYIDQNDNVIILSVDGNRVVVRKIK